MLLRKSRSTFLPPEIFLGTISLCSRSTLDERFVLMSTPEAGPSAPNTTQPKSGVYAALRYTGIPESWIRRPKLPSRNWLIFFSITSSIIGLYAYDRRKCRQIREEYVRRVEYLSQEKLDSMALPRKVMVYSCKWPGDEEHNRGLKYFKKYVKVCIPVKLWVRNSKTYMLSKANTRRCRRRLRNLKRQPSRRTRQHHRRPNKIKTSTRSRIGQTSPKSHSITTPDFPRGRTEAVAGRRIDHRREAHI